MSDIIKDAKQLLDGTTPAPWEVDVDGLEVYSTVDGDAVAHAQTPSDADLIAAAPENAQALAEETWEYIAQVKRGGQWRFYIGESRLPTDKPGLANGFSKVENALEFSKMETEYPTRIVRRRVSPVEPVND